jgi:hypothetical protein
MTTPPVSKSPNATAPVGVGLRRPHVADVLARRPAIDFFEVHPENYVLDRSERTKLRRIRNAYPVSLHGVGLSLGSAQGIDREHLKAISDLAGEIEPMLVSEHLSWSVAGRAYLNDLLPLPYTHEALDVVSVNVASVQDALGRAILIENPSLYARFERADFDECEFLRELTKRTGCGLLLDVNNVFVSAANLGFDARRYLDSFPSDAVEEIHLAGHARKEAGAGVVLIDDHGSPVSEPVWELYAIAKARCKNAATLLERDSNLPPLAELIAEAHKARTIGGAPPPAPSRSLNDAQSRLAQLFLAGGELPPASALGMLGHLSVYRNNVRSSLTAALETAFPSVQRLVGEEYFTQVARAFVRERPPRSPCLAVYGAEFPQFLQSAQGAEDYPYLADVARLDWLASRVAMHDPAAPLAPEELAHAATQSSPEDLVFDVQQTIAYLSSPYPIAAIWSFARAGDGRATAPDLDEGPCFVELRNDGATIRLRTLDAATFVFRRSVYEGAALGGAALAARDVDPLFDLPQALRSALRDGIFVGCAMTAKQEEETTA